MLQIVLVGIGADSVDIVEDAVSVLAQDSEIVAIVFDDDSLYQQLSKPFCPAGRIEDLPNLKFDQLVVCANYNMAVDAVALFCRQLKLSVQECTSYTKRAVGPHVVDWDRAVDAKGIVGEIVRSGTLNRLEEFAYCEPHRILGKWAHYYEVYDRHFAKYRGKSPVVMEIGVWKGGSVQMWKDYFGEGAQIIGIDIDEDVKSFEEEQITIEIGSQEDRDFLRAMKEKYPRIDILIDDGGHTMNQQIVTFEEMFPHIAYGGTYLCEDLHTSYWPRYGGGYRSPDSYIEYSKNFIDYIHAWFNETDELQENRYTRSMHSLHYYNSMLVIEKERMGAPVCINLSIGQDGKNIR